MTVTEPALSEPFPAHDPEYLRDPHRHLASLRDVGPCVVDPASGKWLLVRADEVEAGLSQLIRGDRSNALGRSPSDIPRRCVISYLKFTASSQPCAALS